MRIYDSEIVLTSYEDLSGAYYSHYQAQVSYKGKMHSGFGSDRNRELAAKKSIYELVERVVYFDNSKLTERTSSNGFSAHENFNLASRNSILELIERDAFLTSWLLRKSPLWLDSNESLLVEHESYRLIHSFCLRKKWDLKIGVLYSFDVVVLVGILVDNQKKFGACVFSSAALSFVDALEGILNNAARRITIIENRIAEGLGFNQKINIPKTPAEHFEYYLNPENLGKISWYLQPGSCLEKRPEYSKILIKELKLSFDFIFPISVTYAYCNEDLFQDYFVGATTEKLISQSIIKRVNNKEIINWDFHPLP